MESLSQLLRKNTALAPGRDFTDDELQQLRDLVNAEADKQIAEQERRTRIDRAGIPSRHRRAQLEYCDEFVQAYVRDVLDGSNDWLFIYGGNGRGKTYQACAVLKALASNGRILFRRLQTIFTEHLNAPQWEKASIIEGVQNVPFLVIDDFGKEYGSEYATRQTFEIIEARHSNERVTIFTSNYSRNELFKHLTTNGDETMAAGAISRIMDSRFYELKGYDRRRHA